MNDPDLVIETLDKTEGNIILGMDIGRDAIPMAFNHFGEILERLEPLPLQGGSPIIKETSGPAFALILPKLAKRLFEEIRFVQPFISFEQRF